MHILNKNYQETMILIIINKMFFPDGSQNNDFQPSKR